MARNRRRVFSVLEISRTGPVGDLRTGLAGQGSRKGVPRQCGEDFRRVSRGEISMGNRDRSKVTRACLIAATMASVFNGCRGEETKPTPAAGPQGSAVVVDGQADGIHLK